MTRPRMDDEDFESNVSFTCGVSSILEDASSAIDGVDRLMVPNVVLT